MYTKNHKAILTVLAISGLIIFSSAVFAQGSGLKISPAQLNITLNYSEGEGIQDNIVVTNTSDTSVNVKVAANDSIKVGNYDVPLNVDYKDTGFELNVGESKNVGYSILTGGLGINSNEPLQGEGKIELTAEGGVHLKINVAVKLKLVAAEADIIVSSIEVTPADPEEGEAVTLTATLKNENTTGGAVAANNCKDAGAFNIKWFINSTQILYKRVNSIKAGEEVLVTLTPPGGLKSKLGLGGYRKINLPLAERRAIISPIEPRTVKLRSFASVKLEADANSEVDEVSDSNNISTKRIYLSSSAN